MIDCFKKLFSFSGRIGRWKYFKFKISLIILFFISTFFFVLMLNAPFIFKGSMLETILYIVYLFFVISMFIITLALFTRRLHDLNLSGLWIIIYLIFIVFINVSKIQLLYQIPFFIELALCFIKGTNGPNKYGEYPLQSSDSANLTNKFDN